jgi:hypothetical protein
MKCDLRTSILLWEHTRDNRFFNLIVPEEMLQEGFSKIVMTQLGMKSKPQIHRQLSHASQRSPSAFAQHLGHYIRHA